MKFTKLLGIIALLTMVFVVPVMAVTEGCSMDFVSKNPDTWLVDSDGPTGTMTYDGNGGSFTFTASGLPNGDYVLVSYKEPYPASGSIVMGSGTSNGGSIEITGTTNFVYNTYISDPEYGTAIGAKIWLIPASNFNGNQFTAWDPESYLFETRLIRSNEVCTSPSSDVVITGIIAESDEPECTPSLSIATINGNTNFGNMSIGDNFLPEAGTLSVTSECVNWTVSAPISSPNASGHMTYGILSLANPILQKNEDDTTYVEAISWVGMSGDSSKTFPLAYKQYVSTEDEPGNYGITLTYTVVAS